MNEQWSEAVLKLITLISQSVVLLADGAFTENMNYKTLSLSLSLSLSVSLSLFN